MAFDYNSLTGNASLKTVRAVANRFAKLTMEKQGYEDSAKNFVILRGRFFAVICSKGASEDNRVTYDQTRKWFKSRIVPKDILQNVKVDGLVKAS